MPNWARKRHEQADPDSKLGFPRMYFIENKYSGKPTNWWIPNSACVEAILRSEGLEVQQHPEAEVFICRWKPNEGPSQAVYPAIL